MKAGTAEQEKMTTARKRPGKHILTATNQHATIQELLRSGAFCVVHATQPMGEVSQKSELAVSRSRVANEHWQFMVVCEKSPLSGATI